MGGEGKAGHEDAANGNTWTHRPGRWREDLPDTQIRMDGKESRSSQLMLLGNQNSTLEAAFEGRERGTWQQV